MPQSRYIGFLVVEFGCELKGPVRTKSFNSFFLAITAKSYVAPSGWRYRIEGDIALTVRGAGSIGGGVHPRMKSLQKWSSLCFVH